MFYGNSLLMRAADPELPTSAAKFLDKPLLYRLLAVLFTALAADTPESAEEQVPLCLESIFESCSVSDGFMSAFRVHPEVPGLIERLLLHEPRDTIRQSASKLIRQK